MTFTSKIPARSTSVHWIVHNFSKSAKSIFIALRPEPGRFPPMLWFLFHPEVFVRRGLQVLTTAMHLLFALWTHGPTHSLSATVEQIPESSAALKTASTIAKSTPKPKSARVTIAEEPAVDEAIDSPQVAAADPVVHADPPPFPSTEKITTGLSKDSITGIYGDPALSAMTSTGGHMVETFVYARDGGTTIVRLVDGNVFAVYSQPGPARAIGVFARARRRRE